MGAEPNHCGVRIMHPSLSHSLGRSLPALVWLLAGWEVMAQLPPRRSTFFDGSAAAQVRFAAAAYAPSNTLTLEAWVRREDEDRCETIVAQNFTTSFWFGFCSGRLRFYRQGGAPIDAAANVPAQRWTHVAVVFNPTLPGSSNSVAFYLDGTPAGGGNPRPATVPLSLPLVLGANPGTGFGSTYPFRGAMDEVRVWSVARSAGQIRTNRFRELESEAGLVAVFPGGGTQEIVSGREAEQVAGAVRQIAGILPRDLVVPFQRTPIAFDGLVNDAAYAEAEALVLRYPVGSVDYDVTARLVVAPSTVSTARHLYVALPRIGSDNSATILGARPLWRVYADAHRGASVPPVSEDFRYAVDAYETGLVTSAAGNGTGAFAGTNAAPGVCEVRTESGVEFDAPSIELRLALRNVLPLDSFDPPRGFMMDVDEPFRTVFQPGFTRVSPTDAVAADTTTWPAISPGATIGNAAAVETRFSVVNPDRGGVRLAGARVSLWNLANRTLVERVTSRADGSALLGGTVPTNTPLQLRLELPGDWRFADPAVTEPGGRAPLSTGVATVDFPGCPATPCIYPSVTFFALDPPAAGSTATFADVEPNAAPAAVLLRESPFRMGPAGSVAVRGANFDRTLKVWTMLESAACSLTPPTGDPDPRDNMPGCEWRQAEPFLRSPAEVQFQLQYTNNPGRVARVWLQDGWSGRWLTAADARVTLTDPPYPQVHGFAFENYPDGHDIDDYRAAFPGVVCDPFKMVGFWAFFPIYLDLLENEGECVGMVTSSTFLRSGIDPSTLVRGVRRGAGFTLDDIRAATFDVGNLCAPRPTSLRSVIRSNHGVQTSSQFLGHVLGQLRFGLSGGFRGDEVEFGGSGYGFYTPMGDRLAEIRAGPTGRLICIKPDLLGTGHALLPLGVRDGEVEHVKLVDVYDPNHPGETRVLRVSTRADRFSYDGFADPWRGAYLFVHDIRGLWTGGRDIISIDTLGTALDHFGVRGLLELLGLLVSGSAEPLLTFADGSAWGWRADRTPVATATNVSEIPHFGQLLAPVNPLGHGPAQAFFNPRQSLPAIDLHARGERYSLQVAQGGQLFQILARGRQAGDRDRLRFLAGADFLKPGTGGSASLAGSEPLQGVLFQAGRAAAGAPFTPRVALGRGGSNTVALFAWSGLGEVPAAGAIRFGVDVARSGALFVNDTGVVLAPTLEVITPPGSGSAAISNSVPLPRVPPGAAVNAYLLPVGPGVTPRLRLELDRDRDRRPEVEWVVAPGAPPLAGPPEIRATLSGDEVRVVWPVLPTAWWLAGSAAVDGPWSPVTVSLTVEGDQVRAAVSTNGTDRRFFRLVQGTPP